MRAGVALKVWRVQVLEAAPAVPGLVLDPGDGRVAVACAVAALELLELQAPGGKRLPAAAFLRGHALKAGTLLPAGL